MTIVVGLAPGESGDPAVRLAGLLARSSGQEVLVTLVVPAPWPPDPLQLDAEFRAVQEETARQALGRALGLLDGLQARQELRLARSVASGLVAIVRAEGAELVVLGSAATGLAGHVSLGGVAERILHSAETPVAFAPAGFAPGPATRVARVTMGFGRNDNDGRLLGAAAARAAAFGVPLRIACFVVRPQLLTPEAGIVERADDLVVARWAKQLRADIDDTIATAGADPAGIETVIGVGTGWPEAIADVGWEAGDLLAIGASTSSVSRFLLGSHASKVVRNSPVPVLVLSREHAPGS